MRIMCKNAISGLAVSFLSILGVSSVTAQEILISPAPAPVKSRAPLEFRNSVEEAFDDAFFDNDRDFYKNRSFPRQVDWLLGIGGFPEIEISRDGKEVNDLYREVLARQLAGGPIIRVFDLPSPFCQSLRTVPVSPNCLIDGCPSVGCPVVVQPVVPPSSVPSVIESVPPTQVPPTQQRIPALW
ncbi:MAG: hypothetical protein K6T90_01595 [Leptolyngbyaceae cyanobacterium HOT.MB2.61]|nr:hypothetical protein [Leptolyngbyaceae cyanobacterium HOT.MB2.61]